MLEIVPNSWHLAFRIGIGLRGTSERKAARNKFLKSFVGIPSSLVLDSRPKLQSGGYSWQMSDPTGLEIWTANYVGAIFSEEYGSVHQSVIIQALAKLYGSKEGRSPIPSSKIKPGSDSPPLWSRRKTCSTVRDKVPIILEEEEEEFQPPEHKLVTCSPLFEPLHLADLVHRWGLKLKGKIGGAEENYKRTSFNTLVLTLVLLVDTASVKRVFFAISILKIPLCNKKEDQWLSDSFVVYSKRDIFLLLIINLLCNVFMTLNIADNNCNLFVLIHYERH
ncbi:hypothetical protein ACFX13_008119 [Malus domestica]